MATTALDLEKSAKEAFIDDHFELAVDLYSQAIDLNPNFPELFADRAQANIKLSNFTEAVADANRAIELDPSMAKAYLRKGTACLKLEEYHTAKNAFQAGAALAPGDSRFVNFIKECDERIAEENASLPKPSVEKPAESTISEGLNSDLKNAPATTTTTTTPVNGSVTALSVTIDIPGEEPYHFQPRLFGKITPAKCRHDVLSTKIEIRLAKAEAIQWTSLEFTKDVAVVQKVNVSAPVQRPSYPSSKHKVDWDKLEAQMKKEEKDEKLDGDAALNKFFQDIYKDADEDTRRAMQKSFVESNGTVLSTNWKEVGTKKVEGSAPDGMEMRKWEY
ncbi:hypothetical protein KSS87_003718 [Heliosperma pusillum]|nr:hypothetical protein KSS87_003718 [Heliosperma pusillum]